MTSKPTPVESSMTADTGGPQLTKPAVISGLLEIPDEVMLKILGNLAHVDLLTTARVCKRLRKLALDPSLWRQRVRLSAPWSVETIERLLDEVLVQNNFDVRELELTGRLDPAADGPRPRPPLAADRDMTPGILAKIAALPRLETLIVRNFSLGLANAPLSQFPSKLRKLHFFHCHFTYSDWDWRYESSFGARLDSVRLEYCTGLEPSALEAFVRIGRVEKLSVRGTHVVIPTAARDKCSSLALKFLDASETDFLAVMGVHVFAGLTHLYAERCPAPVLDSVWVLAASDIVRLEFMSLAGSALFNARERDAALALVEPNPRYSLKVCNLSGCDLPDQLRDRLLQTFPLASFNFADAVESSPRADLFD